MIANYNEALERQAEIARDMATSLGSMFENLERVAHGDPAYLKRLERWLAHNPDVMALPTGDVSSTAGLFAEQRPTFEGILHALQFGPTYACTPQISDWLETAARNIPDTFTLERSDLPTEEGFFWTAAPCTPDSMCVHAYSWHARGGAVDSAVFGHMLGHKKLRMLFACPWPYGMTLADGLSGAGLGIDPALNAAFIEANPHIGRLAERIARFWAAMFVFLHQRVFIATPHAVDRPTRRRLERAGATQEPTVRVVHLRRAMDDDEATDDGDGYGEHVHDWHWQWLVRGHWRSV